MRCAMLLGMLLAAVAALPLPVAAQSRDAVEGLSGLPVPRFVSLSAGIANMRAGPGDRYPVSWVYKRRGLPLKVVKEYGIWRQVQDPDGAEGWMNKSLLTGERSAYVTGQVQPLYARRSTSSAIVWRAEPGVVGNLSKCDGKGWCRMSVDGRIGFVQTDAIWGLLPGEAFD